MRMAKLGPGAATGCGLLSLCLWACSGSTGPDAGAPDASATDVMAAFDAAPLDTGPAVDAGPADAEPPITRDQLIDRVAAAECGWLQRCRELEFAQHQDRPSCEQDRAPAWAEQVNLRSSIDVALAHAQACVLALDTRPCFETPRALGEGCWPLLSGGVEQDQPCARSTECANGFCLSADPGRQCGRCAPWRELDDPCSDDPEFACGPHAICEAGRCLTLPGVGSGCSGRCRGLLSCPPNGEGFICVSPLQPGDPCELPFSDAPTCPRERSLSCVDNTCATAILVADGEACDAARWCAYPEFQCGALGQCEARPPSLQGEPCAHPDACGDGLFCDGALCQAQYAEGQPCASQAECLTPLDCLGTQRTCQPPVDLQCP